MTEQRKDLLAREFVSRLQQLATPLAASLPELQAAPPPPPPVNPPEAASPADSVEIAETVSNMQSDGPAVEESVTNTDKQEETQLQRNDSEATVLVTSEDTPSQAKEEVVEAPEPRLDPEPSSGVEIQQQLLDIAVLEAGAGKDTGRAVDLISAASPLSPSPGTLVALAGLLVGEGDTALLSKLAAAIPPGTPGRSEVVRAGSLLQLKLAGAEWGADGHQKAWIRLIQLYRKLLR